MTRSEWTSVRNGLAPLCRLVPNGFLLPIHRVRNFQIIETTYTRDPGEIARFVERHPGDGIEIELDLVPTGAAEVSACGQFVERRPWGVLFHLRVTRCQSNAEAEARMATALFALDRAVVDQLVDANPPKATLEIFRFGSGPERYLAVVDPALKEVRIPSFAIVAARIESIVRDALDYLEPGHHEISVIPSFPAGCVCALMEVAA